MSKIGPGLLSQLSFFQEYDISSYNVYKSSITESYMATVSYFRIVAVGAFNNMKYRYIASQEKWVSW